ncbi:cadmium-translocating P-type ATPase [Rhizobium sp. KVB221]|uniref:Cadmium-translocating P-type ATPase n=1 Tax=Rhizobium setariae TaxID=2801340 RepID=A0A937CLI1_9HYPH|nr:cation-translocating P-type ATPase [Rhizobium setariae]MBL0373220.1 cadmium-translocating P-type ATPase [Rhizobium setariae]
MSCCAPGTEGALQRDGSANLPSGEELWLSSRDLGNGLRQLDLGVPEVHCGTCITTIESALRKLPEVDRARVNLSTKRVSIVWREVTGDQPSDPSVIATAIASTGYSAHLFQDLAEQGDALRNQLLRAVAVAGFAATNIMLLSVSVWSGADAATRDLFHWISAMIAAPALVYSGRFFFRSAWTALRHGHTNMDVPISLAVILSYGVSLYETMNHGEHAWFDATVSLLFFLLIGRTLDHLMRDRARSAVVGLARLSPRGAMVVSTDGAREYRPVNEIRPGVRLLISAGERIAVDGTVISGTSDIDWSIVNGESTPVAAKTGDKLLAGTLNLTGSLTIEAAAEARNSFLAEIISLMEAAEGGKARYRRIADRAAQLYSPVVHLLAALSFIGWGLANGDWKHAMLVAVAVLIITCPCALGLAVPVVQVIAAGRLFKSGIMVKDGSAMERLAETNTIFFDKTGTLTLGRPRLRNAAEIDTASFAIAAGLAAHSRHPLSRALASACPVDAQAFDNVQEIAGGGLQATAVDGIWRLGNRRFALGDTQADEHGGAFSEVILSRDFQPVAAFNLEDATRPEGADTITQLKADRFETAVLSGDREAVVARLARSLGINNWTAGLDPQGKVDAIRKASEGGAKVLMVGDGINDAPALRTAHVSMAPSTAADVGRQAADFVFMREGLSAVTLSIDISKRAGKLIRENFALAIGYNVIAVPIAILGYATPLIAAIAMSTSSIIVVVNSLRLNRLSHGDAPRTDRQAQAETGGVLAT